MAPPVAKRWRAIACLVLDSGPVVSLFMSPCHATTAVELKHGGRRHDGFGNRGQSNPLDFFSQPASQPAAQEPPFLSPTACRTRGAVTVAGGRAWAWDVKRDELTNCPAISSHPPRAHLPTRPGEGLQTKIVSGLGNDGSRGAHSITATVPSPPPAVNIRVVSTLDAHKTGDTWLDRGQTRIRDESSRDAFQREQNSLREHSPGMAANSSPSRLVCFASREKTRSETIARGGEAF